MSIFFYFSTPFLYACVFGMGLFFLLVRLGGGYKGLSFPAKESPCYTNLRYLFILLSSEKNEPKAPPQLSGFWLVATVAVGVCGTRSAQTVLALFPPSSLRLRRQIKAESGIVAFACILTPSVLLTPPSFGHLPYILLCKTPRNAAGHGKGEGDTRFVAVTADVFNSSVF